MLPKKLTQNFNPQNTFFTLASDAKRLPHIGFSSLLLPLLFILFGAIVSQLLFFAYTLGHPKSASPLTEELFILVGLFSLTLLAIWLWMKFFEGRSFRSVGLPKQCALKKYFTGFFLGILMLGSTLASMAVFGIIQIETESIIPIGVDAILPVTLLLFGYVIQGGSEEILFRGWQFQVISVRYKPWIGALVSSLVFALMHGLNYGINIVAIANLIFFQCY